MVQGSADRLVDDLDGGNADESVNFTVDNKRYQMDLSEKNAARLREILAPFIAAARRPSGATTTRTRRSPTAALAVETPTVEADAKPKRRSRKKIADPFTAEQTH